MFDEFIERKTEQEAKTAKDGAEVAISWIKLANLDLLIEKTLNEGIAARDQKLAEGCAAIQTWLNGSARRS
ncbi:MAG TPA: hypothetical protein VFS02_05470 [Telluria sp.]|nr:hypothetical protein [Telluria sp.]